MKKCNLESIFSGRSPLEFITARKGSLGQGNIFAPVCHSVHRGGTWEGTPPLAGTPSWPDTPPWQVHHPPG